MNANKIRVARMQCAQILLEASHVPARKITLGILSKDVLVSFISFSKISFVIFLELAA